MSLVYSRSPADPDSDAVLLPPTGMLVSTAIISARMSRTGWSVLATYGRARQSNLPLARFCHRC